MGADQHEYQIVPSSSTLSPPPNDTFFVRNESILVRFAQSLLGAIIALGVVLVATQAHGKHDTAQVYLEKYASNASFSAFVGNSSSDEGMSSSLKVAFLMSFPNSGTSYTLKLVRRASNMSTASNYCNHDGDYVPVYASDVPGPHLIRESKKKTHLMPRHYILTKTHCAHCTNCQPSEYVVTTREFQEQCFTECYRDHGKISMQYNSSVVGKALHLFRDPFDNIISRFHCQNNAAAKKHSTRVQYASTPTGFQEFCRDQDKHYAKHESKILGKNIVARSKGVPCHADFYRYVQWHNHASEMLQNMNISTHVLYYEDYHENFNGTLSSLLNFLEMPYDGEQVDYHWSNYTMYYSDEERAAIGAYIREIASSETWSELGRYFHL